MIRRAGRLTRATLWQALVLLLGLATLACDARAQQPPAPEAITPGMQSFLRTKETNLSRSANDVGWDCLAAAALLEQAKEEARPRLNVALREMLARAVRTGDGTLQWRPNANAAQEAKCGPGGRETFGKCDGPETIYTFQTGLGIACMALSGRLLQRPDMIAEAQRSLAHWDAHRTRNVLGCFGCMYYWVSDNPNSRDRYVRNLNLFLGFAAAAVGWVTRDDIRLEDARAVARADIWERKTGNAGYLGRLDPLWRQRAGEDVRIENHAPSVALLAEWIGRWTRFPEAREHGLAVWRQWAFCANEQCKVNGCRHWAADPAQCRETATYAHCAFRQRAPEAAEFCRAMVSDGKSLPPYGIWAYATGTTEGPAR